MTTKFIDLSEYWKAMIEKLDRDNLDEELQTEQEIEKIKTQYIEEFGYPAMPDGFTRTYDFYNNGKSTKK